MRETRTTTIAIQRSTTNGEVKQVSTTFFLSNFHFSCSLQTKSACIKLRVSITIVSQTSRISRFLKRIFVLRGGGGRGRRFLPSHLPYFLLPFPAPFRDGFLLFVLSLLKNIIQCCEIFSQLLLLLPLWESRFSALSSPPRTPPVPIFTRSSCPPSQCRNIFYTFCPSCLHLFL